MSTSVVIGGGSGIGQAVVGAQRALGHETVVWDLPDKAPDVACDLADPAQIEAATAATIESVGVPELVTITAGVGHGGWLLDAPVDDWDRVMGVNARGVWLAMRSLARPMLDADGGSIVVTSSVSAELADKTMGIYCASKAALDMVVAVAAVEWAPLLRVNAVAPGVTSTAMLGRAPRDGRWLTGVADRTPLGRLGEAADIAETIVALHTMTWVTGQSVRCDGGLSRHSPIDPLG